MHCTCKYKLAVGYEGFRLVVLSKAFNTFHSGNHPLSFCVHNFIGLDDDQVNYAMFRTSLGTNTTASGARVIHRAGPDIPGCTRGAFKL